VTPAEPPDPAVAPTLTSDDAPMALASTLAQERRLPPPLAAGTARYERGRELGKGGMGRVVEAVDRQFNRVVAIKELSTAWADSPERLRRFTTESLVTGNLEHPGIPSVYERGIDERGVPFYAMRKVNGRTLAALLAETRTMTERLALLPVVVRTAQTLGYAHEHGVIHRDVKPDNVIVGPYGDVVLLDWGIARVRTVPGESQAPTTSDAASPGDSHDQATVFGAVVGTPAYMAPEQAAGHTDRIDERTDVFALGALLYHVLTGRAPYGGASVEQTLDQAREGRPRPVRELERAGPEALAAICERAMARQPADRHRNATELARALEVFESQAILARPQPLGVVVAVHVVTAFAVLATIAAVFGVLMTMPDLFHLGSAAYLTIVVASIGGLLSGLDWWTRGRYSLAPMAMGFALTTLCAGMLNASMGLVKVFGQLAELAGDPVAYREVLGTGTWESLAGLSLGVALAGVQFLLWGVARARGRQRELVAGGAETTISSRRTRP
jgi:hypothetical protein